MEGADHSGNGKQLMSSAFGSSSSSVPNPQNQLGKSSVVSAQMGGPVRLLYKDTSPESSKKPGLPPSHPNIPPQLPYPQFVGSRPGSLQLGSQTWSHGPSHSRSLSQPSFFSLDCLPSLSPLNFNDLSATSLSDSTSTDVSMEESAVSSHAPDLVGNRGHGFQVNDSLPPRKGHRRSSSDTPLGFSSMVQSSQLISTGAWGMSEKSAPGGGNSALDKPIQLVKKGLHKDGDYNNNDGMDEKKSEDAVADDLIDAYMNLDNFDNINSFGTEDKNLDSRASGSKTSAGEGSDNEVDSSTNRSSADKKREGIKRSANGDVVPNGRHQRSFSLDSFMENFHFEDDSPKLPPLGNRSGSLSPSNSADGQNSKFSPEFGSGDFTEAELKKIMENEKLAEIALTDPKRAKRILANRQSAARSKERKMRYIAELEHKVQTLQTETTTLSAKYTKLQRDNDGLKSENNELKFRLQAMDQQSQLKDALNGTLTAEVQRLRHVVAGFGGESVLSSCLAQKLSINQQTSWLQHPQTTFPQQVAQMHPQQLQPNDLHSPQQSKATEQKANPANKQES